jgi:peptidoglycan hydrolase-like protein with peptidoglycan-binding domain
MSKTGSVGGGGNSGNNNSVSKTSSVSNSKSNGSSTAAAKAKSPAAPNSQFVGGSINEKTGINNAATTKANLLAKTAAPSGVPKMDAAAEARLAKVNPQLANRIRQTAADLKAKGIKTTIVNTGAFRTPAMQNALYAQGRESLSKVNAMRKAAGMGPISAAENKGKVSGQKAWGSFHNYGLAVDLVPVVNGKPTWKVPDSTWKAIGAAGKKNGLEWGGDWKKKDLPHFEMAGGAASGKAYKSLYDQGGMNAVWNKVNKGYPNFGGGTAPTNPTTPTVPTTPTTPVVPTTQTGAALKTHLEKGYRGQDVKDLQTKLVNLGYMSKAEMATGPGVFGPRTQKAVEQFQAANGLKDDGVVGPGTRSALNKAGARQADAVAQVAPIARPNPVATTASAAKINNILKGTNLAGKGEIISQMAKKYNVPAEVALAMFRKEAGFASTGSLAQRNNNPGNIRFRNQDGAVSGAKNFAKWNSMDKGIEAYFKLLDKGYRGFIDNKDWSGLVNKYAPPIENDSRAYTNDITKWMSDYRNRIN